MPRNRLLTFLFLFNKYLFLNIPNNIHFQFSKIQFLVRSSNLKRIFLIVFDTSRKFFARLLKGMI